jgi:hypothetical protein
MRTRLYDALKAAVVVVALVGALRSGQPLDWAPLVYAIRRPWGWERCRAGSGCCPARHSHRRLRPVRAS